MEGKAMTLEQLNEKRCADLRFSLIHAFDGAYYIQHNRGLRNEINGILDNASTRFIRSDTEILERLANAEQRAKQNEADYVILEQKYENLRIEHKKFVDGAATELENETKYWKEIVAKKDYSIHHAGIRESNYNKRIEVLEKENKKLKKEIEKQKKEFEKELENEKENEESALDSALKYADKNWDLQKQNQKLKELLQGFLGSKPN